MDCLVEVMEFEDIFFIFYIFGIIGKPKGIVYIIGGYVVGIYVISCMVFDFKEDDVYWCMVDVGWIIGYSYIVYGFLQCGVMVMMYEGVFNYLDCDRFWVLVEKYNVMVFYMVFIVICVFMKWGDDFLVCYDLSSIWLLGSVGEFINLEVWMWYYKYIGGKWCFIVDIWWQIEIGGIMIFGLLGVIIMKLGFVGFVMFGVHVIVLDELGNEVI